VPSLALSALWLALATRQIDTTVAIGADGRLDLTNARGYVHVKVWDRPAVRIQADLSESDALVITQSGRVLNVIARSHTGMTRPIWLDTVGMRIRTPNSGRPTGAVDYEITIPRRLALSVSGLYTNIVIDSVEAAVDVGSYVGDITARGGGPARLETVAGTIVVDQANGRIDARTLRGDIAVRRTTGDIDAKSVNGSVSFSDNTSARVVGVSYSAPVSYRGPIQPRGRYDLSTQSGPVFVHIPPSSDVTLELAGSPDKVRSCKPLPSASPGSPSRRRYVYGTGSALMSIDSFEGTVEICFDEGGRPKE